MLVSGHSSFLTFGAVCDVSVRMSSCDTMGPWVCCVQVAGRDAKLPCLSGPSETSTSTTLGFFPKR